MNKKALKRMAMIALAKKDFWTFCKCLCPTMYNEEHKHLKEWCDIYQDWYENRDETFLVFSAPPRHGKTMTAQFFCLWCFGRNPKEKIAVLCYNKDMLAVPFGKKVREYILAQHINDVDDEILFCDIFPDITIKKGDGAADKWSLEGSPVASFLSCSYDSAITGFGATLIIIDDIVKDYAEAINERKLRDRFTGIDTTIFQSRLEKGCRIVCSSTRWAKFDISGQLIENYKNRCYVYSSKALRDDGTMLCDAMLNKEDYEERKKHGDIVIFLANFQQELIDVQGRLYEGFKTWKPQDLPQFDANGKKYVYKTEAMIDVADRGTDYLACIFYYPLRSGKIYINDIIFTQAPTSQTEDMIVEGLHKNDSNMCILEGNNGGTIFKESIKKAYNRLYGNSCLFKFFLQTKNKESRILNQAGWVQENIYLPDGWEQKFPEFYEALAKFQRDFKTNKHDDAADCMTMIADRYNSQDGKGLKIYS